MGRRAWLWTPTQIAAVEGHPNHVNSIVFDTRLLDLARRARRRLPRRRRPSSVYNAADQPGRRALHARRLHDQRVRPAARERCGRRRSSRSATASPALPLDNVGVQYGLEALQKGQITPAQFVDLNAKIGGVDIDINHDRRDASRPTSRRSRNAYRSGGDQRDQQPRQASRSSTCAGPTRAPSTTPTARGRSARGSSASTARSRQPVIWFGAVAADRRPELDATEGLIAMDRWLDGRRGRPRAAARWPTKIVARPARATSTTAARTIDGVDQVDVPGVGHGLRADAGADQFGTPRDGRRREHRDRHATSARSSRCGARDYYPIAFTDDQWARLAEGVPDRRLRLVSKPGVEPAGDDPVADLPGRTAAGRLRRPGARPRAGRLGRGLDERLVRRLARVGRQAVSESADQPAGPGAARLPVLVGG